MKTSLSTKAEPTRRVLVVDDNPAIHGDFHKILAPKGTAVPGTRELEDLIFGAAEERQPDLNFELDSAYQGQEALAKLETALAEGRPYALAFVDVRMPPGWDGLETVSRLWAVCPQLQVVICTAYSDYSWDQIRARFGRPDSLVVLKKPFDNIEIQQLAHALTRKWELNIQAGLRLDELEDTVQKRTEALRRSNRELARSEERFAKAFNISPLPMAIISLQDHRWVDANDRLLALTGQQRASLVGRPCRELAGLGLPGQLDRWFAALNLDDAIEEQPTRFTDGTGNVRELLASLAPVVLSGQPHALLLLRDVTARNLLQQQFHQAQKMEVIGQLAAGVAHDFNNLLSVIHGHASLIRLAAEGSAANDSILDSATEIAEAGERAAALTRQLLAFSRKQPFQLRPIRLDRTVEGALKMLRRLVGEHIAVEFEKPADLPPIEADASMIEQVLLNLAVNARDAMRSGGQIRLSCSARTIRREPSASDPVARSGSFVELVFADNGSGMEPAVLSRAFEPFFTTKANGLGTGLGLATVRSIVRQHHGWIDVQSGLGEGTTFRIYFPESLTRPEQTLNRQAAPIQTGAESLLVVEDEKGLRDLTVRALTRFGYKVVAASSGPEGLEACRTSETPFDLVLADILLPGMSGTDLARAICSSNPKQKVAFTSGYTPDLGPASTEMLRSGSFLAKPFTIPALLAFVRANLDQRPD